MTFQVTAPPTETLAIVNSSKGWRRARGWRSAWSDAWESGMFR